MSHDAAEVADSADAGNAGGGVAAADGSDASDAENPAAAAEDHPVLLFDGVCNLCAGSVQFVVERDPDALFRFAPLQSAVASELLAGHDIDPDDLDSVVLLEDGHVYTKSTAALRVARELAGPSSLLWHARFVPRSLRDAVYDVVAAVRYDVFGKKDRCMVPTGDLEERFLARN